MLANLSNDFPVARSREGECRRKNGREGEGSRKYERRREAKREGKGRHRRREETDLWSVFNLDRPRGWQYASALGSGDVDGRSALDLASHFTLHSHFARTRTSTQKKTSQARRNTTSPPSAQHSQPAKKPYTNVSSDWR